MHNREERWRYRVITLLSIRGWLAVIFIAIVGIIVAVFSPKIESIDDQATVSREIVRQIYVVDENSNGFRVCYATIDNVTKDRLAEIQGRSSVRDSLDRLKTTAPIVFGDMLMLDIYDFADYAIRFDPADIRIHNIFVSGPDKMQLYIGENPRIENWAKWINPATGQGLLYLRAEEIYCIASIRRRVYRYFLCRGLNQISEYDEHFSHFSEDDRIY